jgi:hypothetical protein
LARSHTRLPLACRFDLDPFILLEIETPGIIQIAAIPFATKENGAFLADDPLEGMILATLRALCVHLNEIWGTTTKAITACSTAIVTSNHTAPLVVGKIKGPDIVSMTHVCVIMPTE